MNIKLVSWTNNPIKTIYWAFMNMHNKIPDNLNEINLSEEEINDFLEMLMSQPHQTVLEFVKTTWLLDGVSRAFQQQLTRTRLASYSIQSLRIIDVGNFAKEEKYTCSDAVKNNPAWLKRYRDSMDVIESFYRGMVDSGMPIEDARGILPLNIQSPITMSIDLRSLYHLLELRFCENAQGEFKEVALAMKKEIADKIHPILTKPMVPICFKEGVCPSVVHCGKYDFKQKLNKDVSKWIKG